ncbi:hypothetical protein K1T71_008657 [Dendrolimus kikuchii]|uniref:Uncharacterized protein n=1 Tax=Dendrolimus kikuchii TaxID=765133 RepID=A0ACC1CW24_9NEOP|nr:hypothetical protein K1T71_008657 [Dendrolimus kikuchii]
MYTSLALIVVLARLIPPLSILSSYSDSTAKLRFYHNSFNNYTELNFKDAAEIFFTSWYDPNKITVVFTFGFTGEPTGIAVTTIITGYLEEGKKNVVLLNWEQLAAATQSNFANSYLNWAIPNSIKLGFEFADVLLNLSQAGLDLNKLHLIGHSLGAHMFGITGYRLAEKGMKLQCKKESVGVKVRKGMLRWFGHVERMHDERMTKQIYNAKVDGCRSRGRPRHTFHDQIDHLCNHHRCWRLLRDALNYPGTLIGSWAKNFRSWKNYSEQEKKAVVLELGVFDLKAARGNYFFTTKAESPYGLGNEGL